MVKEKLNWRSTADREAIAKKWTSPGTPVYHVIDPTGVEDLLARSTVMTPRFRIFVLLAAVGGRLGAMLGAALAGDVPSHTQLPPIPNLERWECT